MARASGWSALESAYFLKSMEQAEILDQIAREGNRFNADMLGPEQIAALKELEKANRNIGARGRKTEDWASARGPFRLRAEARTYLHYLSLRLDQTVLDAGSGMGRVAMLIAPQVGRLVCVDFSEEALRVLEVGASRREIRNIETVVSDLCCLPRSLGPFDRACAIEVIEHIPSHRERLRAMRQLYHVLKPGGRCVVSVYAWNRRTRQDMMDKEGFYGTGERRLYGYRFTPRELKALLQESGFQKIRVRGLTTIPKAIATRLPPALAVLETWNSLIPGSVHFGWWLLAVGMK